MYLANLTLLIGGNFFKAVVISDLLLKVFKPEVTLLLIQTLTFAKNQKQLQHMAIVEMTFQVLCEQYICILGQ